LRISVFLHKIGLLYCIEFLEKNIEWLKKQIEPLSKAGKKKNNDILQKNVICFLSLSLSLTTIILGNYLLFDCPGQVELYTVHNSMKNIVLQLQKWQLRVCCVHLVDSVLCQQPASFIAAVLLSLSTSLQLELPHINVLTKIDLLPKYDELGASV
jgi:GTPase SAR1 family protein